MKYIPLIHTSESDEAPGEGEACMLESGKHDQEERQVLVR